MSGKTGLSVLLDGIGSLSAIIDALRTAELAKFPFFGRVDTTCDPASLLREASYLYGPPHVSLTRRSSQLVKYSGRLPGTVIEVLAINVITSKPVIDPRKDSVHRAHHTLLAISDQVLAVFGRRGLIFKAGETLSEEKYDVFSNSNFLASKIMGFASRRSGSSQRTRAVHASGKRVNIEAYRENTLEVVMNNKDEYLEILEKQVDQWQSEIMKFRLIAEVADKDDQIEHYQIIDDITDQINAFRSNLDELKAESAGHWSGFQEKLQSLKQKVNRAIDEARKKIN